MGMGMGMGRRWDGGGEALESLREVGRSEGGPMRRLRTGGRLGVREGWAVGGCLTGGEMFRELGEGGGGEGWWERY